MRNQCEQLIKMANQIGTSIGSQLFDGLDAGHADEILPVVRSALTNNRELLIKATRHVNGDSAPVEAEAGRNAG